LAGRCVQAHEHCEVFNVARYIGRHTRIAEVGVVEDRRNVAVVWICGIRRYD
jgi:hypothetical protein